MEPGALQDLPKLETLILTKNGISRINRGTIKNLPSLQKVKLNDNLIQELEEKSFSDLLSLKELHLQHNFIDTINDRAFVRVPSLRYVSNLLYMFRITNYVLYNIKRKLMLIFICIIVYFRYLNMSFNLLQDLPRSGFLRLKTLETLDLSFNDLRQVDDATFEDMHWLSDLKVSDNIHIIYQNCIGSISFKFKRHNP